MIHIDLQLILLILIIGVLITLFSGSFKGICDGIGHEDKFIHWGKWWSKQQYYESKYEFIVKHPFWNKSDIHRWFAFNVIIMFLDAWHFFQFLSQAFDHLLFIFPLAILLSEMYGIQTFIFGVVVFLLLYIFYQIGFRLLYK